ncbi:unnamed protein product [Rotaria sordida]|uniref:Uncharacterized protein n=1 Tax=Rotaria sordida TaxID=392033 RepID=A0A815UJS0_9BILA|nr:unnamed protein product [Rotaria sordida]
MENVVLLILLLLFRNNLHVFLQYYLQFTLGIEDVLLLSLDVSHRRRLINQCRAQAGQKALQKTFSLPENSNEQILINQFAKGFCSKSFDERISKEIDINYKISIDEHQNQIVKQSMSNLFKQFSENKFTIFNSIRC